MAVIVPFDSRPCVAPLVTPEQALARMLETGEQRLAKLEPGSAAYRELEETLRAAEDGLADDA